MRGLGVGRGVGGAALLACLLGGAGAWRAGVVDLQHLRLQRAFRPTRMVPSPPSMCSAGGGGGGGSEKGLRDMPGHLLLAPAATEEMSPSSSSGAEIELDCSEEDSWMGLKINDIPLTSDIAAIMLVYFVQGALGLGRLAIQFFLKDDLGLPPAQLAALTGLFALPWVFKPVYGFLSDGVPIGGYRRKSYLALSGMLGAAAWVYLSQVANAPAGATGACIASNLGIAVSDVVADSIVVEKARESRNPAVQSGLQSLCWGSSAVGGVLSAYFSGSLLEHLSVRQVFGLTSALPLLIASSALLVRERRLLEDTGTGDEKLVAGTVVTQAQLLWGAIRERSVWLPALFVFLWHATPSSDGAFFYFLTNDIGVGPEFLGRVRLGSSLASLVGVGVFQTFLRDVRVSSIMLWSSLASIPLGLTQLLLIYHVNRDIGIPDQVFTFGDDVILTVLGQVAFMPVLVLAARLCPPGVEATLFASLMSIFNLGGIVGSEAGALLTSTLGVTDHDFSNLGLLVVLCNLSSLLPLPFLKWIRDVDQVESTVVDEKDTK